MTITHFDTSLQIIEYISTYISVAQADANLCFNLAISGGKTPLEMFKYWSLHKTIDYTKSIIYQIDERYIQNNNKNQLNFEKYSNQFAFKNAFCGENDDMKTNAQGYWLDNNFVPINVNLDYSGAVVDYNLKIQKISKNTALDLALLGFGTDGHFASIFPNNNYNFDDDRFVISTTASNIYPISKRISLTPSAISKAKKIIVTLVGQDKKAVLDELQNGNLNINQFPAKYWLDKKNIEILCCF